MKIETINVGKDFSINPSGPIFTYWLFSGKSFQTVIKNKSPILIINKHLLNSGNKKDINEVF